jgi:arylsulfatase A-like enzyme
VQRAHPEGAPSAGILCPSIDYRVDGGDMPALILPPPGRVEIPVPFGAEEGILWLDLRAGVDRHALQAHHQDLDGHSVRFRVGIVGGRTYEGRIPLRPQPPEGEPAAGGYFGSEWLDVLPSEGLPLRAGQRLVLETALLGPSGAEVASPPLLEAGFGGLACERRFRVRRTPSSPSAPNLVLIVMDTQRADRTSVHGYHKPTTPNLERLAARGLVFESAYATASWTWPSTASILSGLHPQEHGVLNPASCFLADSIETLPEVLQRIGVTTAAWSANPLIVPDKNFDQGFELFDHGKGGTRQSATIVPAVLDWLGAVAGTRFFLYVHLADTHAPLVPLPAARRQFAPDVPLDFDPKAIVDYAWPLLRGEGHTPEGAVATERLVPPEHQRWIGELYDACTWSGDYWVGRILARLDELGLSDETVVAYTSDHGEELFDHGLATHAQSVYRELTAVPLVLAGPGVPRGERVAVPVSSLHLAPTLARLAGAELHDPEVPLDLTRVAGEHADADGGEVLFSTMQGWWNGRYRQPIYGLRAGDYVLHYAPRGSDWGVRRPDPEGQWRLYDLSSDPEERVDLAGQDAERALALRDELRRRVGELEARRRTPTIEAGDATLEMLRAIGYIGDR